MWFRKPRLLLFTALLAVVLAASARADLPPFLQHIVSGSVAESALYRTMHTVLVDILYPRPPAEAARELQSVASTPALLALRARTEEDAMNYSAAEADWKRYAETAPDHFAALEDLSGYYIRRQQFPQELEVLAQLASAPAPAEQQFSDPWKQAPWLASVRALFVVGEQAMGPAAEDAVWKRFLARYPKQPSLYARYFNVLLGRGDFAAAETLLAQMKTALPDDRALQLEAEAALAARRGDASAALAVYDRSFSPLWPEPLLASYFGLLNRTHRAHTFLADAQARLLKNPDDLDAAAREFLFYRQGTGGAEPTAAQSMDARDTLERYRLSKESRHAAWTPQELYTLAHLSRESDDYPEAARYDYALAALPGNLPDGEPAAEAGLAGLTEVLLSAPEQPIALGSGNLSLLHDIATLDSGPGYWNGILSLWLNGTDPAGQYATESAKAQPYFHRAKAAQLLAMLDQRFPAAPQRAALHLQLLQATAQYGDPAATVAGGRAFLEQFPTAKGRLDVVSLTADAYARQKDETAEFALYDSALAELAARAGGQPLSAAPAQRPSGQELGLDTGESKPAAPAPLLDQVVVPAPEVVATPQTQAAEAYRQLLDRYLGRLTATNHLPQALAVLRRQLDRNPDDPRLYERLAAFLEQNNLSAEQEAVYKQAIAKFPGTTWQDRLGRFYLKQKRRADFAALTRQVTDIFSGTELDVWFGKVQPSNPAIGPNLALQLDLYAAKRFPHDLVFVDHLLTAYSTEPTKNPEALDALLRQHWWESPELRDQFFERLTETGKLEQEIAAAPAVDSAASDPAALREHAEALIWRSDFEQAAPELRAVSALYPADPDLGDRVVSLYRSLSYNDPSQTAVAVEVEERLARAEPYDGNRLATLGDLYAEATANGGEDLAAAAPFWQRIPQMHPGTPAGYLTAATIFWDYFQFDQALEEIAAARQRFGAPALYGYEAGAIEENRHDLPAAVHEYIAAVLHPPDSQRRVDSAVAVLRAALAPPSDAADSDLVAAGTDFFGTEFAQQRLRELATRPETGPLVDRATAEALAANPSDAALRLRIEVLVSAAHEAELPGVLETALRSSTTPEQAAAVGALAQTYALTPVYQAALARQSALTPDPVEKIRLQFALARSQEDAGNIPAASRTVAAVYAANPRLLGVVRTTVDFYTRTHQEKQAVATLVDAAAHSTPQYADAFTLEAAQDSNTAGETGEARTLALSLLAKSPYDARYLAAAAESFSRAHDDAGLKAFYLARLDAARSAPAGERRADIALLRRGLIPALTGLHDFAGAEDQYIALESAYPEDTATAREAALYALAHDRQPQLLAFLNKTVQDSSQDSRFAILLAETQTTFGNLPAAVAAYSAAIAVRQDRADLYTARAELEQRLALNNADDAAANAGEDRAAADFARLYTLSYHDPQWMEQLAQVRARQNRPADAVKALQTAYLSGQAGDALIAADFKVAARLESWGLLPEAQHFAEQGRQLAGASFLTGPSSQLGYVDTSEEGGAYPAMLPLPSTGAAVYVRVMARQGHAAEALSTLIASRRAADAASPGVLESLSKSLADGDSSESRQDLATRRRQWVAASLDGMMRALGAAVGTYGTPENRVAFGTALDAQHAAYPRATLLAAHAAGLLDREAAWRRQALLAGKPEDGRLNAYVALQTSRLQFAALGATLEQYAAKLKPEQAKAVLAQAARAYGSAGNPEAEIRLSRRLALAEDTGLRDRFLDLLLRRDPGALNTLAAGQDAALGDAAVNYALEHGSEAEALAAVGARGRVLTPVWLSANTALTGLSYVSVTHAEDATTDAAFRQVLTADATIGQRLAAKPDPAQQLVGSNWFPYAASYAVFRLAAPGHGDAEDYAAAQLENGLAPSGSAFTELAQTYAEAGHTDAALREYAHALELDPADSVTLDAEAVLLQRAGRGPEAQAVWHRALQTLAQQAAHQQVPESFFTGFQRVLASLGQQHLTAQFASGIEAGVHTYLARSGNYRSNELLREEYSASATPAAGTELLLASVAGVPQEADVLADLANTPLELNSDRPVARGTSDMVLDRPHQQILERRVAVAQAHVSGVQDGTDPNAITPEGLLNLKKSLIQFDLDFNQTSAAAALEATLPQPADGPVTSAQVEILTRTGGIAGSIARWEADPRLAPDDGAVQAALLALCKPTFFYQPDPAAIRPLLDWSFQRKRIAGTLTAPDYLAVAENHLQSGDLPGALDVLHRLALAPSGPQVLDDAAAQDTSVPEVPSGHPLANLDAAARLLERTGHAAAAVPLLELLHRGAPWNTAYALRLGQARAQSQAQAQSGAGQAELAGVARNAQAPYVQRVRAAEALAYGTLHPAGLGSAELDLLAAATPPTPAQARQPLFAAARVASAASGADPIPLLREAVAIDPEGRIVPVARVRLLQVLLHAPHPAEALPVLDAFSRAGSESAEASVDQPASAFGTSSDNGVQLPAFLLAEPLPERVQVATGIARAEQDAHQPAEAVLWLRRALDLNPRAPGSTQAQLAGELRQMRAVQAREEGNRERLPVVRETLGAPLTAGSPTGPVRPRLVAGTSKPASTGATP